MKKAIFIIIIMVSGLTTKEQILGPNLVNNPSFEAHDTCPNIPGLLNLSKFWWGYSTDYFNSCANANTNVSVPFNFAGYQHAYTGNAYAGFTIYSCSHPGDDYRETIKTKLNSVLNPQKKYCTNMYVSLANFQSIQPSPAFTLLDSIGMLFTNYMVPNNTMPVIINGARIQNSIINIDTVGWYRISNVFTANGNEQYLAIGDFSNFINYIPGAFGSAYVYVDDVSVCECSFNFNLGNDTILCNGESLTLNPNMPNAIYTWQDGSHASTYVVTQPGTYWLSAYIPEYHITTSDTINIMYQVCDSSSTFTPDIYIPTAFTPANTNNNIFKIITFAEIGEFKMCIYYRWYGLLFESDDKNKGWDGTYRGKLVPPGVYVYYITATLKDTGERIEKAGSITVVR